MLKMLSSLIVILFCIVLQSKAALAHTPLMFSIPAKDAVLQQPPKMVMLHFGDPVRMLSLELTKDKDTIAFGFRRNSEATDHIEFELPSLNAGSYQFAWSAMGADGHRISGVIAFTVDPNATKSLPAEQQKDKTHHQHHASLMQLQAQGN